MLKNILNVLRNNKLFTLIIAVVGFLFFLRLGRNAFWDWDECLYGQYAVEMPRAGHYLTNIWNGYIDMQKPPLYTWLLQIPRTLLGNGEFSLRLLSAIAGIGIIVSVYVFCKKYYSHMVAIFASLILVASELIIIYSLRLNTDIIYTLCIFLAFWAWLVALKKDRFVYIAGMLFGISTMLKGIGTIQFLGAIFVTVCLFPKKIYFEKFIKMILTYLVIIVPWHLLAYQRYGDDFIRIYIFENIIQRGKYPIEFHRERWWFYFTLLLRELKPWILAGFVVPVVMMIDFLKAKKSATFVKSLVATMRTHQQTITLLVLILMPLASFTRFQTRIAWYALPLYPFIAVYLGYNIDLLARYVSNRFTVNKRDVIYLAISVGIVFCLAFDAGKLLANEIKPLETGRTYNARELAINKARTLPHNKIYYLVHFGERQAMEILPPTEQIDMTWIYGGHPCAVYYSNKKVDYFYSIENFKKQLGKKGQLYLRHKDDEVVTQGTSPVELYSNEEYVLFTY